MPSESESKQLQETPWAVRTEGLSVNYRTVVERRRTLKESLLHLGRGRRQQHVVPALKNVDLELPRGALLGVIGANGAGKSTLLRTVAGILPPSEGKVSVRGRVTTLLATGVGFNRQLTGRQNIRLGGLAIGLKPFEIDAQMDEVVNFAGIGEFIDMPAKIYSSGMFGRLAFSVAVHMNPEILLVDEALSAGDAAFRAKAAEKMRELIHSAEAIMLVTHGLGTIEELATHALWLHKGEVMGFGSPTEIVSDYSKFVKAGQTIATREEI